MATPESAPDSDPVAGSVTEPGAEPAAEPVADGPDDSGAPAADRARAGDDDLVTAGPEVDGVHDDDGGDGGSPPAGLTWPKVAVLGLALAFLGFAIGYVVTRDRSPAADSADVGFLQDMITHHDQALGVANLTAAHGEDPSVRTYAREVLIFQSYEIGVMTQMLADWGFTREDRSDEAMAWMDMAVPVEQMPGLLTEDQLDQVGEARGAELDSLFLELMAEHHRGGLHMAQEGAELASDDRVAALAARIERNQAGEINEYRMRAEALGLDLDIAPAEVPPANLPPTDD
ncbi:MAG TPA: DUF305 domain-containing protein [Acidimicrobiales bacterium]|nr:DUF305 domain-containing protein [Acidimicrobiales bacterium]